jgi:hypothetical protein
MKTRRKEYFLNEYNLRSRNVAKSMKKDEEMNEKIVSKFFKKKFKTDFIKVRKTNLINVKLLILLRI